MGQWGSRPTFDIRYGSPMILSLTEMVFPQIVFMVFGILDAPSIFSTWGIYAISTLGIYAILEVYVK